MIANVMTVLYQCGYKNVDTRISIIITDREEPGIFVPNCNGGSARFVLII